MSPPNDTGPSGHYERLKDRPETLSICAPGQDTVASNSKEVARQKKTLRSAKKRADIQSVVRERREGFTAPAGTVWACCMGAELYFPEFLKAVKKDGVIDPQAIQVESTFSEVFVCRSFSKKLCFLFRFGCVVAWDVNSEERQVLASAIKPFTKEPLGSKREEDDMSYIWAERAMIKADRIHLVTSDVNEGLAYSYAFAQSVKLAVFETVVDDTIDKTRKIPEGLARTGTINSKREDISRQIGELFVNRFYINLHTDILDTPDIFWDNDDFADHYDHCRRYLEIPKRVDILNQRLDIIKDLYDMLNNELTIQHGYKLEWIVIYLICIEVLIEVVWNIMIKDVFKLV